MGFWVIGIAGKGERVLGKVFVAMRGDGKNRPSWRAPKIDRKGFIPPVFVKPVYTQANVPEQFRCQAIARTTGERCKRFALHGAKACAFHGGHSGKGLTLA